MKGDKFLKNLKTEWILSAISMNTTKINHKQK